MSDSLRVEVAVYRFLKHFNSVFQVRFMSYEFSGILDQWVRPVLVNPGRVTCSDCTDVCIRTHYAELLKVPKGHI